MSTQRLGLLPFDGQRYRVEFQRMKQAVWRRPAVRAAVMDAADRAGMRTDPNPVRWWVRGCDAGTEPECAGLKSRLRWSATAGAYGSKAAATPCRQQRSSC